MHSSHEGSIATALRSSHQDLKDTPLCGRWLEKAGEGRLTDRNPAQGRWLPAGRLGRIKGRGDLLGPA